MTKLIFCGSNEHSQLGIKSNNKDLIDENPCVSPPIDSNFDVSLISSLSFYCKHTIIITTGGEIFASGDNSDCSIIGSLPKRDLTEFTKFEIKDAKGNTFYPISAVCGEYFTVYLVSRTQNSDECQLAISYKNIETPYPLFLNHSKKKILSLFGGDFNAAAIDSEGSIIFIPRSISSSVSEKLEISRLPNNEEAVSIACCDDYIYVLGSSGRVFVSEPGIGKFERKLEFALVKSLEKAKVVEINGKSVHCLAVTEDGKVFGCGSNYCGQLSLGEEKTGQISEFTFISSLSKYKIRSASAGCAHSLFETSEGIILSSGGNMSGELLTSEPSEEYAYLAKQTEINGGSTFCVAGMGISAVFIGHDPLKSPNRRIIQKNSINETNI